MLEGKSGERISLCMEPNGHLLNLGVSGSGKSYYIYRRMEELWQANADSRRYVVLDYSNSFTPEEMQKAGFFIEGRIFYTDLTENSYSVFVGNDSNERTSRMLQSMLLRIFKIGAYQQKKILLNYCANFVELMKGEEQKPLSDLFQKMAQDIEDGVIQDKGNRRETLKLLKRLEMLEQCRICISRKRSKWKEGVHIVQFSNLSEEERKVYVNLILRLYWYQVRNLKTGYFTTYIVDEFQYLDLSVAVEDFLREGRKFGASMILSSQYVGKGQKKYVPALKQAANQMFFRPVDSDVQALAEMIDQEHAQEWRKILSGLQVGEAVLSGSYTVNENQKVLHRPIVVNVQSNSRSEKASKN